MADDDWLAQAERQRLQHAGASTIDAEKILRALGPDSPRRTSRNLRHQLIGYACTMLTHRVPVNLIVDTPTESWYDLSDAAARSDWPSSDLERVSRHLLAHPQDPELPLDPLSDLVTSTRNADHALEVIDAAGTYERADAAWLAGSNITTSDIAWVAATMPDRSCPGTDALTQIASIDDTAIRRLVLAMASGTRPRQPIGELAALAASLTTGHDTALRLILDDWDPTDAINAANALNRSETRETRPAASAGPSPARVRVHTPSPAASGRAAQ